MDCCHCFGYSLIGVGIPGRCCFFSLTVPVTADCYFAVAVVVGAFVVAASVAVGDAVVDFDFSCAYDAIDAIVFVVRCLSCCRCRYC